MDSPWFCHLQMYSPLSWPPLFTDSPFKLSLFSDLFCLFYLILLNYLFFRTTLNACICYLMWNPYINKFDSSLWAFIMTGQPLLFSNVCSRQPQLHSSFLDFLDWVPPTLTPGSAIIFHAESLQHLMGCTNIIWDHAFFLLWFTWWGKKRERKCLVARSSSLPLSRGVSLFFISTLSTLTCVCHE